MKKLLPLVLVASVPALAFAVDLKPAQEEAKAKFDEAMEAPLKALNEKCGTKVTMKSDYENYKESEWSGSSYYSWCDGAVEAIATMCESRPAYKKVLSKKLTGFQCLFAGVKPKEKKDGSNEFTLRNMSFSNGTFVFHISKDNANISDNAKTTMEKALN